MTADEAACEFARRLVNRDYTAAHGMMCPASQIGTKVENLKHGFEFMMDQQAPMGCHMVMEMEQWQGKEPGDLAWVYVAIDAGLFSEAITVVVCGCTGHPRIRQVEWGRP